MRDSLVITVDENNITTFVHDDELMSTFGQEGESLTVRATLCEPQSNGRWAIDLGPSGGPIVFGFESKRDALFAEVQWLEQNVL
jgi:hypothetical protein